MFGQKFFPYSTLQELNLDWILTKVKNILRFVPDDGAVGQILRRTRDGAEWSDEQGGGGAVDSVNGQTGTVVLTASDVGALPDSYTPTFPVTSVNTKTGAVVLDKTDVGLGNVANVTQYSASNPPPYPVTSVNGQTGDVTVSGGAVDSVNGQTGIVVLGKSDVGLGNVDNVQQYSSSNPPPYPVTSVNGQTGAVVIPTGGIYSEGSNFIKYSDGVMIEWKVVSLGFVAINTAWGAWYYSSQQSLGVWDEQFYSLTGVLAQAYISSLSGGGDFMVGRITDASATSRGKCYLYAPVSLSSTPAEIMVYGIGRWKA